MSIHLSVLYTLVIKCVIYDVLMFHSKLNHAFFSLTAVLLHFTDPQFLLFPNQRKKQPLHMIPMEITRSVTKHEDGCKLDL